MRKLLLASLSMIPLTLLLVSVIFAQENYEPGVILVQVRQPEIVRFNNGQVINSSPQLQAVLQQYPATGSRKLSHVNAETDGWYRLEFPLTLPLTDVQSALIACTDIADATFNYYGYLCGIPNDSQWGNQWALQKIQMPNAWDVTKPNSTILVGVIDTGLDYNHVDLADNIWTNLGWDFVDDDNNPIYDVASQETHATEVAGVIAARTYNTIGLAGIAGGWQNQVGVRLIGLRIFANDSEPTNQERATNAVNYLTSLRQQGHIVITNMSFTILGTDSQLSTFKSAVDAARNAGVIMVAGSGNDDRQPSVAELLAPARWDGVLATGASKDGATLQDELRLSDSMYDWDAQKLLVVAPVDKTPTLKIVTTFPENQYTQTFGHTSAGSSIASGVVALILSLNPNLTYQQISNIIASTAEKIGNYTYDSNGRSLEVGYGRINAYQALLLTHAYSTKSMDAEATAHNGGRRLVRDGSGNYHLVFASGGEIFYRKNSGGLWQTPQRLSAGNGNNKFPSITERNNRLYAVWQRQRPGTDTYDIYFSTKLIAGTTWPTTYILATTAQFSSPTDPLPVIQTSVNTDFSLMVVFRDTGKLRSYRTTNSNPTSSGNWTSADVPQTNSSHFWPSVAGVNHYWGSSTNVGLAYAGTDNEIYYDFYQPTAGGWQSSASWPKNMSIIVPTSRKHDSPSLTAVPGSTSLHLAWHLWYNTGGSMYDHSIVHRKSSGFDNWPSQYTELYGDKFKPSITAVSSGADIIFQYFSGGIGKMHYNGSSWGSATYVAPSGQYPSVSSGSTQAKYVWNSTGTAPYTININSTPLSKEGDGEPYYERRISWLDSSGAHLTVRVKGLSLKNAKGEVQSLALQPVSLDTVLDFTPVNAFDYLVSVPVLLPADAESLVVDFTLWTEKAERVASGTNSKISLEFKDDSEKSLTKISGPAFNASGSISEKTLRLGVLLATVKQAVGSKSVKAVVKIEGLTPNSKTFASLGHIYDFNKSIEKSSVAQEALTSNSSPKEVTLLGSYPNPFNPETTIKYQVRDGRQVRLNIFNLRGQKIRALVDELRTPGMYETRWDGKDEIGQSVASGIYVIQIQAGEMIESRKITLLK